MRPSRRWLELTLGYQSLNEVRVRRDSIHPAPPPELRERLNDAVKGQHEREQETKQDARNLCRRTHCSDGLPDSSVVGREEDPEHEVGIAAPVCRKPDGPVPTEKEERRSEDVPGNFYKDLRRDERWPRIDSARTFPDLIHFADIEKHDLELIRKRYTQNQGHEHRLIESRASVAGTRATITTHKEFVLRALERVVAFEKGEPDKQTADNVQHQLCHQIARGPPIMCKIAHEQVPHLIHPRRCKSRTDRCGHGGYVPPFGDNGVDFLVKKRRLGRFGPDLVPIPLTGRGRPSTNDVEDELGST